MDVRGRRGEGGGRLYTYRFTVTTGITSALLHDHTVRSVSGVCGEKLTRRKYFAKKEKEKRKNKRAAPFSLAVRS